MVFSFSTYGTIICVLPARGGALRAELSHALSHPSPSHTLARTFTVLYLLPEYFIIKHHYFCQ